MLKGSEEKLLGKTIAKGFHDWAVSIRITE